MSDRLEHRGLDQNGQAIYVAHVEPVSYPAPGVGFWHDARAMYACCRVDQCGRFWSAYTALRWARASR